VTAAVPRLVERDPEHLAFERRGQVGVKYTRALRSSTARIADSGDSATTMNSPDVSGRISLPSLRYR
jgi:hypothetical protein